MYFNFMQLSSIYPVVCFKQVFQNAAASRNSTVPLGCEQLEFRHAASADCSCSSWFKVA
jgi:hypothetical protein